MPCKVEDRRIIEQQRARAPGKIAADQQIAVAMHEVDARPARIEAGQRFRDRCIERVFQVVIARPVLEQVAEDVERLGFACSAADEPEELLDDARPFGGEVQVRDEEAEAQLPSQASILRFLRRAR